MSYLHIACAAGSVSVMLRLIEAGMDPRELMQPWHRYSTAALCWTAWGSLAIIATQMLCTVTVVSVLCVTNCLTLLVIGSRCCCMALTRMACQAARARHCKSLLPLTQSALYVCLYPHSAPVV